METIATATSPGIEKPNEVSPEQRDRRGLASCNLCRKRKIKCDRSIPCSSCRRAGQTCVTTNPPRLPRGRQGGRRKANHELLQRIAKLENLVKDLEGDDDGDHDSPSNNPTLAENPKSQVVQAASAKKNENSATRASKPVLDRYMSSPFWFILSDEIHSLREVLEPSDDEDEELDDQQDSQRDSETPPSIYSSNFVLSGMSSPATGGHACLQQPSYTQVTALFAVYFRNVDPVFKILHRPSIWKLLEHSGGDIDRSLTSPGLTVLTFVIYYAAITSLDANECLMQFGGQKEPLLAKYRASTELALAKADFVNTTELATVQALLIFLVCLRSNDTTRLSWTLMALVVRIGQALGLHREPSFASLPHFQKEMRRRLWWQIVQSDLAAAEDRGTDPIISANSFNTLRPQHIDDEDISPDSVMEPKAAQKFCDMTFVCICQSVSQTVQVLNYVPAGEVDPKRYDWAVYWNQRRDRVIACRRYIEDEYLKYCDLSIPSHWVARMVADVITATMWLITYRPLQRHPSHADAPFQLGHPNVLQLGVEVLEHSYQIHTDPAAKFMQWLSLHYVPWHAYSVTLAELCVQPEGPLVDRAWAVVDALYQPMEERIADSNRGMLWRPIKKLFKKAQSVRKSSATKIPSNTMSGYTYKQDATNLPQQTTMLSLGSETKPATGLPNMQNATTQPNDWDWEMLLNTNPTDTQQGDSEWARQAWTSWDRFLEDFHGEGGDVMQTQEYLVPSGAIDYYTNV